MNRALLDADPLTGVRQYFGWDDEGGEYLIDEMDTTDTQKVIDRNRELSNHHDDRSGDMWLVASIPPQVQFEWLDRHGVEFWNPDHKEGVKRLLNDPDYRWLKTKDIIL